MGLWLPDFKTIQGSQLCSAELGAWVRSARAHRPQPHTLSRAPRAPVSLPTATGQSLPCSLLQPRHPPSWENGLFPDPPPGGHTTTEGPQPYHKPHTPAVAACLELFCHLLVTPNLLFLSGHQDGNQQGPGVADGDGPSSLASTTSRSRPESVPTFWSLTMSTVPPFWG